MEGRGGGRERGRKQWRTSVHYSLMKKKRKNYLIDFSQEVLETEMHLLVKLVDRCLPLVIFTLKNYITFVLISLIQTENINNKLITITLKIRKSPALTLVLVVLPYFPPPLEKRKQKGEKKKEVIWTGKALLVFMYV